MKLVIDGVFFSLAQSGIARVWRSIMPHLAASADLEIILLDRGDSPSFEGVKRLPFPSYKDLYNADDSALLQKVCDQLGADVFVSTYHTTPLSTPTVMLVHDMIPELMKFDSMDRHWQGRAVSIAFARRFVAVSHNTAKDLLALHPEAEGVVDVAHNGVDPAVFHPVSEEAVQAFRRDHGLERDYVLLVGSREQHMGYKNGRLLFRSLSSVQREDFDIVCIGGEPEIAPETLAMVPPAMSVHRLELDDAGIIAAYSGARALAYPSLYEGFGLPVVEAMACGCPVITTDHGSLAEVAGDAAIIVDGHSTTQMAAALDAIRDEGRRSELREAGLERSKRFRWNTMAETMGAAIATCAALREDEAYRAFSAQWADLRTKQAEVDTKTWRLT